MSYADLYDGPIIAFLKERGIDLSNFDLDIDDEDFTIDIEFIVINSGKYQIEKEILFDDSGFFDNKETIHVNVLENENRQRFTIAHELGHALFEHGPSKRTETSKYSPEELKKERIANQFAADILMPRKLVEKVLEYIKENTTIGQKDSINNSSIEAARRNIISEAARLMSVSEISLTYRIKNLGIDVI